jgi:hypothetical protein
MKKQILIPHLVTSKITKWLDSKVADKTVENKYEIDELTIKPYKSHYGNYAYYGENDIDTKNMSTSDKYMFQLMGTMTDEELKEDMEIYKLSLYADHVLIRPNTNRYHANLLFRKLIDQAFDNDYDYDIYNVNANEHLNVNLMDISLKKSFYKFCYDNS